MTWTGKTHRQAADSLLETGLFERRPHVGVRRGVAEGVQVVAHIAGEDDRILSHRDARGRDAHAIRPVASVRTAVLLRCGRRYSMASHLRNQGQPGPQIEQPHSRNVDAIDEDAAAAGLDDPLERHHERALAAASAPRNAHLLPSWGSVQQDGSGNAHRGRPLFAEPLKQQKLRKNGTAHRACHRVPYPGLHGCFFGCINASFVSTRVSRSIKYRPGQADQQHRGLLPPTCNGEGEAVEDGVQLRSIPHHQRLRHNGALVGPGPGQPATHTV